LNILLQKIYHSLLLLFLVNIISIIIIGRFWLFLARVWILRPGIWASLSEWQLARSSARFQGTTYEWSLPDAWPFPGHRSQTLITSQHSTPLRSNHSTAGTAQHFPCSLPMPGPSAVPRQAWNGWSQPSPPQKTCLSLGQRWSRHPWNFAPFPCVLSTSHTPLISPSPDIWNRSRRISCTSNLVCLDIFW